MLPLNTTKCCICDCAEVAPRFTLGTHAFVQCNHCKLVYIANFTFDDSTYKSDYYFVLKHEYVKRWDEFCSLFEHLVARIMRFKQEGIFLDIGAGVGTLVQVAGDHGFRAHGVEVSEWASAYARDERGLNVVTGTIEDAAFPDAYFDVIVVNHVLEHVTDPAKLLGEANRILKDNGVIIVGVPNIGSIMSRLLRERWPSLRPEEHIWHFTPRTLRRLMNKTGFQEIWFEARDNYSAQGWGPRSIARRIINRVSVLTDRSEAMLLFAQKQPSAGARHQRVPVPDGPARGSR